VKLQTQIPLQPEKEQIDYNSKVLLLGSCFVENIGAKLEYYKFQNLGNPFGIIFHPVAIEKLVKRAINKEKFTEKNIFFSNENWHCFEVHSLIFAPEKEEFLKILNTKLEQFREYLLAASHIIFTYGTAWVYRFKETDAIVANCHKVPQKKFVKELLSVKEICDAIDKTTTLIKSVNSNVAIITTVSPVRHLKDGFVENTLSKAHLISGLHEVKNSKNAIHYFPSYEVILDELRDYRFYKEDMIHPNNTAITIVWENFSEVWISAESKALQKEIETIQNGLNHRPFNPESKEHKAFQVNLQKRIENLKNLFSHITF